MACLHLWILLFCFTFIQSAPLIYPGNPFVLPESHQNIDLYLEEEEPTNIIFAPLQSSTIYPLNPSDMEELYLRLSKQSDKSSKYLEYISGVELSLGNKKCCDNEWFDYGAFGRYNGLTTKPVFQLGYGGYPSNQIQDEYSNSDVKPVTEHIEGDLKYDFRTNTHSI